MSIYTRDGNSRSKVPRVSFLCHETKGKGKKRRISRESKLVVELVTYYRRKKSSRKIRLSFLLFGIVVWKSSLVSLISGVQISCSLFLSFTIVTFHRIRIIFDTLVLTIYRTFTCDAVTWITYFDDLLFKTIIIIIVTPRLYENFNRLVI